MRGARGVIGDISSDLIIVEIVSEMFKKLFQLGYREEVKKHQEIRLFGSFVSIGGISFGFENPVEPENLAVQFMVFFPVEFFQFFVSFELADDSIFVKRNRQSAADFIPL